MAQYIYSRVSTDKQENENQLSKLRELYPEAKIIEEVASSMKRRPHLEELLIRLERGDELIVSALDRLGRRTSELLVLIEGLGKRGILFKSIREGLDYATPSGRCMIQILCVFAEMERNVISERTKLALAAKKRAGIHCGRKPTYAPELIALALELRAEGLTLREVSAQTGISISRIAQLSKMH